MIKYPLEKPHKVNVCGKDFIQRSKIGERARAIPYKCNDCGKALTLSSKYVATTEFMLRETM